MVSTSSAHAPTLIDPRRIERAALLISECQNGMLDPELADRPDLAAQAVERGIAPRIARLAEFFRTTGRPVVHSTIVAAEGFEGFRTSCLLLGSIKKVGRLVAGHPAADIYPELAPQPGDLIVERQQGLTPFHGTELEELLSQRDVRSVVIVGVSTNIAIPSACVEAVNRGLYAVVPEDCTAGAWPEAHEFQVMNTLPLLATVTDSATLIRSFEAMD